MPFLTSKYPNDSTYNLFYKIGICFGVGILKNAKIATMKKMRRVCLVCFGISAVHDQVPFLSDSFKEGSIALYEN